MSSPFAKRGGRNREPSLFRSLSLPVKIGIVTGVVVMTWFDYHMATMVTYASMRASAVPPVTLPPLAVASPPVQTAPPVAPTVQSKLESFDLNVLTATHTTDAFESNWFQFALGETEYGKSPGNLSQVLRHYGEIYGLSKAKQTELAKFWSDGAKADFGDQSFVDGQVSGWVGREKNVFTFQMSAPTTQFTYSTFLTWTKGDKFVKFQTMRTRLTPLPKDNG